MNLKKLSAHYLSHDIFFKGREDESPVEEWLEAREESFTIPRDSDSENEMTDRDDQIEEQESLPAPTQATASDSSSDSSSENESQTQKRKKCHKKRTSDRIEKQLNSVVVKVESDQWVNDTKFSLTNGFLSDLSNNLMISLPKAFHLRTS